MELNSKLKNAISIFDLADTKYLLADIKLIYRKLASVNHPDRGGSTEVMQLINTALDEFNSYFQLNIELDLSLIQNQDQKCDFDFVSQLKKLSGLKIEVCGYWVWVSGDTYSHKDTLKDLGFKFSATKKAWYWSPALDDRKRRGSKSLKDIRKSYGSSVIHTDTLTAIN
jgi:hypothetical protein